MSDIRREVNLADPETNFEASVSPCGDGFSLSIGDIRADIDDCSKRTALEKAGDLRDLIDAVIAELVSR